MIIPPFETHDEMRACRREIINIALRENHICKGKRFPSFKNLRGYVRTQEYLSTGTILHVYKDWQP